MKEIKLRSWKWAFCCAWSLQSNWRKRTERVMLWRLRSLLHFWKAFSFSTFYEEMWVAASSRPWCLCPFTLYLELSSFLLFNSITFLHPDIIFDLFMFFGKLGYVLNEFYNNKMKHHPYYLLGVVPISKVQSNQELRKQTDNFLKFVYHFISLLGKEPGRIMERMVLQ